jgi:glycine betaine/choline ABC-type transport system substrate-binding protein
MKMKSLLVIAYLQGVLLSTAYGAVATGNAPESSSTFISEYNTAKNEALTMSQRWAALQRASSLATGEEFLKVVAFGDSKDWFMRNASLVALEKSGSDIVYDQAKKLITDKALVVRSAAADILMKLNGDGVKKIFSAELEKKYNFNGKSSLWIRKQMMTHLVKNATSNERDFYVRYLYDKDVEIAALSTKALEKITQVRFTAPNDKQLVAKWQKAAQQEKW